MKVNEVPFTLAEHDSDIKIKACTQNLSVFVTRFCAYHLLRYQLSVYRTIGPLVLNLKWGLMSIKIKERISMI